MSDTQAQEPTMEEILASIRRIISEDDAPAAAAEGQGASAPATPDTGDDVLELTQPVAEAPPEPPRAAAQPAPAPQPAPDIPSLQQLGDLDVSERAAPPAPAPAPAAAAPAAPPPASEALVSSQTADAAAAHFGQLAQSIAMPAAGRTLEDLVREMLRPLLKEWLDQHLPEIVQARVQAEVERVSRGRGY
jgi:uncharacterized protein